MSDVEGLVPIVEAALLAAGRPLTIAAIGALFDEQERPGNDDLRRALDEIRARCDGRGYELVEVASGFRFQVRERYSNWVSRLWQERPQKYSRALLETLALIAYRQPITRGEIEEIRGVAVSTNIIRTLHERDWIKVVGHRDVPGRPSMYATTRQFLDYFNLRSLDQLPALADLRDLETLNAELGFDALVAEGEGAPAEGEAGEHAPAEGEGAPAEGEEGEHAPAEGESAAGGGEDAAIEDAAVASEDGDGPDDDAVTVTEPADDGAQDEERPPASASHGQG